MTRLVLLSDTHGLHERLEVPEGDVLVHAGDFTMQGSLAEVERFAELLDRLPHRVKIVVAGNHDFAFERQGEAARALLAGRAIYLEDAGCEADGLRFWGSPWQPWFHDWAFNLPRGAALAAKWSAIPDEVDVLVTHGPPHGILDRTLRGEEVGCEDLLARVGEVRPRLHVFGHIHEAAGRLERDGTTFVNAAICSFRYDPIGAATVVEL